MDEERLRRQDHLRPEPIRVAWDAHVSDRVDLPNPLWEVLMFREWLQEEPYHR